MGQSQIKEIKVITSLNFNADYDVLVNQAIVNNCASAKCTLTAIYGGEQLDVDNFAEEADEELTGVIIAYLQTDGSVTIELDSMSEPSFKYPNDPEIWIEEIEEVA